MKPVRKAVILASGEGKRMRPLTLRKPKPLLEVAGKTFLDYIFESLPQSVSEVVVVVGYKGDQIKEYLGNSYLRKKVFYINQKTPTGTAHALLLTKPHFKKQGERFLVFYGDELPTSEQIEKCASYEFSWLCREMDDPGQSGVAEINREGRIISIVEKPENPFSNIVVAGAMLVDTDIFDYAPRPHKNGEYYLTSLAGEFIKTHFVRAVMGTPNVGFTAPEDIDKFRNGISIDNH